MGSPAVSPWKVITPLLRGCSPSSLIRSCSPRPSVRVGREFLGDAAIPWGAQKEGSSISRETPCLPSQDGGCGRRGAALACCCSLTCQSSCSLASGSSRKSWMIRESRGELKQEMRSWRLLRKTLAASKLVCELMVRARPYGGVAVPLSRYLCPVNAPGVG